MEQRKELIGRVAQQDAYRLKVILAQRQVSYTHWLQRKIREELMESDVRHGYKVLTYDYCSPLQGGAPLFDGTTFPATLPAVTLDTSTEECAAGWHYCASIAEALPIVGLWPTGYPSRAYQVEASADAIQRGTKRRASSLLLLAECEEPLISDAITQMSRPFAPHDAAMAQEQWAWRQALGRPMHAAEHVETSLKHALTMRALSWTLQKFDSARAAWAARDARAAWAAWAARDAWAAWAARDAWAAWAAWPAWAARDAWAAWDARDAWAAWAARDAWAALTVFFAASQQWISQDKTLLTTGLRDAYAHGLAIALPVAQNVLGWAMVERKGTAHD